MVACAAALGWGLFNLRGEPWKVDTERKVVVTVVPADRARLRCKTQDTFGAFGCSKRGAQRLAPYVTVDRELIVLSDVFSHDPVRQEAERRSRGPTDKRRFRVECEIKHLAYSAEHRVRFAARGPFEDARSWIAQAKRCRPLAD